MAQTFPPEPDWREILTVAAALEAGLMDAWSQGHGAALSGINPRAAAIVGRALADRGWLEGVEPNWRLGPKGRWLLDGSGGADRAANLILEAREIRNHTELAAILRGSAPTDDVSAGDPDTRRRFMRAMREISRPRVADAVAAIGAPRGSGQLIDIGGAPGSYAAGFVAAGWSVTVADLPDTLAVGATELAATGVGTIAADITEGVPPGPWDAIYLGNILHLLASEHAAAAVASAAHALAAGGVLAIQEVLGDRSDGGRAFGVMMLASTAAGDAYPHDLYRQWMDAADCPLRSTVALQGGAHHLLLGWR